MNGRNSELVSLTVYLKPNKNWCVGYFTCFDHDRMVGSRICMSKDIDPTNSLLSIVYFVLLDV